MNLVVVSQCAKNALTETRRILDQFAERSGHRTWIFESTDEGQKQIRKMLKRTARKNTAVICYHIKKAGGKEILWLVGNPRKFNETGAVPTNSTGRDLLSSHLENTWHNLQIIKLFAAIAGLFHDVGKANVLFQKKLKNSTRTSEPVRHEWISLLMFDAFVNGDDDQQWLTRLSQFEPSQQEGILQQMVVNGEDVKGLDMSAMQKKVIRYNPFKHKLKTPVAQIIGWLIVSHHKLPDIPDGDKGSGDNGSGIATSAPIRRMDQWLTVLNGLAPGNSPQIHNPDWENKDWQGVFKFTAGKGKAQTPLQSQTWCRKANNFASRLLQLDYAELDWMQDPFVMHLARLSLMLSDHLYSAKSTPTKAWQDSKVKAYANTHMQDTKSEDEKTLFKKGDLKQKLDEHNIGVAHHSFLFPNLLPNLRRELASFSYCKPLKQFASNNHFRWQNKAYQLACGLKERSQTQGFIGFNLASTGRGKTLGNAKIMYALADEKQGCRFSVALGLRTLTLQTGDAFKEKLKLNDEDIAVMIGSQAVLKLHHLDQQNDEPDQHQDAGSESLTPLFARHDTVHYEGINSESRLQKWFPSSEKAQKMLNAPILVSTIDHLIPATDGCRGGKQIAPMLRLLTADLVLDEPDDFGLEDLPAVCRLVNWAGMLGARVLLSSATIPPDLAQAAFEAYEAGRRHYRNNCLSPDTDQTTLIAWFDENDGTCEEVIDGQQFRQYHSAFVNKRITFLQQQKPLQQSKIIELHCQSSQPQEAINAIASAIYQQLPQLQQEHGETHPNGKGKLSLGLLRMANINQLVAVSKQLLQQDAPDGLQLHVVVYHSRLPLIIRSNLESQLDVLFNRETPENLWHNLLVKDIFANQPHQQHMILVLSSPVCEVGRNWDADFAICEPSSFRSFIQLAGRVNRHRRKPSTSPNLILLNQNYKSLTDQKVAFSRPGFENPSPFNLVKPKDLKSKTREEQIQWVSAIPRIAKNSDLNYRTNLVDLEHVHTQARLFGLQGLVPEGQNTENDAFNYFAAQWWQNNIHWCQRHQQKLRFRQSQTEQSFFFYLEDEDDDLQFYGYHDNGEKRLAGDEVLNRLDDDNALTMGRGVHWFYQQDLKQAMVTLSQQLDMDIRLLAKSLVRSK